MNIFSPYSGESYIFLYIKQKHNSNIFIILGDIAMGSNLRGNLTLYIQKKIW